MTREEAISEWTFRSNHIKKWLDEYGEEPSIRHYVELIDMAIEALHREEAEAKGWCHRIRPKNVEVVVRCKDCRHYQKVSWAKERRCVNPYWATARGTVETDFCSHGERQEK